MASAWWSSDDGGGSQKEDGDVYVEKPPGVPNDRDTCPLTICTEKKKIGTTLMRCIPGSQNRRLYRRIIVVRSTRQKM